MSAYLAAPDGWPPGPGVVVVQEWWGLNDQIEGVCRRLAEDGYAAMAPDLYRGLLTEEPDEARKLAMELDRERAIGDLRDSVGWMVDRGGDAVGILGFCMGGSLAFEMATVEGRLLAAVVFYGMAEIHGRELHAPVMAHYGSEDRFGPEVLEELRTELDAQRFAHQVFVYEGAGHAFFNETKTSYREEAAETAWERTIAFLRNELGTGPPGTADSA